FFAVPSGAALTLQNLTLQNGLVTGGGGAIFSDGTLNLNTVTLQGNQASGTQGLPAVPSHPSGGRGGGGIVPGHAAYSGGAWFGAGLYVAGDMASLTNVVLSANSVVGG